MMNLNTEESAYKKSVLPTLRTFITLVYLILVIRFKTILTQQQELKKKQVKLRDQRNELNKLIREEARRESFREQICRAITEHQSSPSSL